MKSQPQLHPPAWQLHAPKFWTVAAQPQTAAAMRNNNDVALKLLIVALFLPEGLSFFIGDFRLTVARVLMILLSIHATARYFRRFADTVFVPSDLFAVAAGFWMIIALVVAQGADGLKSGGILALEFTGAYCIFRQLLGPVDSAVRVVAFASKLMLVMVALATLDPVTGTLFTYETVKALTGYSFAGYEWAKEVHADWMYRNGNVRAMGTMDHPILFGAACAWFGTLAICTFPSRLIGWSVAGAALLGIFVSQARGPLLAYALSLGLVAFYYVTPRFYARWRVLGALIVFGITFLCLLSSNPLATLLKLTVGAETGWYRQAIWEAVAPLVLQSPLFGMGLGAEWDWQASRLAGESVDAMWLRLAMIQGIPASLLVLLTMVGAYWDGPLDRSPYLSREERRLSVALGIVTVAAIFLGFTVHFWNTCWILLGSFAGIRANLVEARACRHKAARRVEDQPIFASGSGSGR